MESSGRQNAGAVRAKLEFPVWHRNFTKAYTAWANAPSDLKTPLLLQGNALAKAESWLLACPERLSESQKRYIVRSISQRAKGPQDKPTLTAATDAKRWIWRRSSDRSLWSLYAVIGLGLWFFSPDIIRDTLEHFLNSPESYQQRNGAQTAATQNTQPKHVRNHDRPSPGVDGSTDDAGNPGDEPDSETQSAAAPEVAPLGDIDETPALYMPEVLPPSPAVRMAELSGEQLEHGNSRAALLLAIEAGESAINSQPVDTSAASRAAGLISRAMATREQLAALAPRSATARTTMFCDDARSLIAVGADEQISVWPHAGTRRSGAQPIAAQTLNGASVDRECRRMLLPNDDYNVEVRSMAGGKPLAQLIGHEADILSSSFSPDGASIVTASQDSTARIWDARTGRQRALLSGHDWHVLAAEFSPDGRRVVTASSDKTARIWDTASGREIQILKGHQGSVTSAKFSADGTRVLTSSWDGYARLWDTSNGKEIHAFKQPDGILIAEMTPDGSRIATTTGDGSVHFWDGITGELLHAVQGEGSGKRTIRFTPDGRWLTTLTWMGRVDVYDAQTGTLSRTLAQPEQHVRSMQLGNSARTLVAVTEEGLRLTWPLIESPAAAILEAKAIAPACLSANERATFGLESSQPKWCATQPPRGAALP